MLWQVDLMHLKRVYDVAKCRSFTASLNENKGS